LIIFDPLSAVAVHFNVKEFFSRLPSNFGGKGRSGSHCSVVNGTGFVYSPLQESIHAHTLK